MIRRLAALLAVLALPGMLYAEVLFTSISVTAASATTTLTRPARSLSICNCSTSICAAGASANSAYVRVFSDVDTAAASTTAYQEIAIGACYQIDWTGGGLEPGTGYLKIAAIAGGGGTATLKVTYK